MKKIVFTLLLSMCLFTSCEPDKDIKRTKNDRPIRYSIEKIDFEGHEYLIYHEGYGRTRVGGFTHSENCQCKKQK